jgi:hypothetical protein
MSPSLPLLSISKPTRGLLFIGDPHLWSLKPGRRRDTSYKDTVLRKITLAAEISNRLGLWPIFTGDLFHHPDDNNTQMLVQLMRVLNLFERRPVSLEGNHDKNQLNLVDSNPLRLLEVAEKLDIISEGPWAQIVLESEQGQQHRVVIGGTPFGQALPIGYKEAFGEERTPDVDTALWLTHEDLAFDGSYPDALPLLPMKSIDLVVNGHMHGTKAPVKVEDTVYYNPGNITRMSVDMADHVPAVWEWTPFTQETMVSSAGQRVPLLRQHVLEHTPGSEIFDFEGRHTRKAAIEVEAQSGFVAQLLEQPADMRTDDGTYARAALSQVLDDNEAPEAVRIIANHLCEAALRRHREEQA